MKPDLKKNWVPSQGAFRRFLDWLDEGVDSGGRRYLEMRGRLTAYFDRRNGVRPDELADETLNRVARRLEEEGAIPETPARYCYIVARFVFLESVRAARDERKNWSERPEETTLEEESLRRRLLEGIEDCLELLASADRELILEYYRGERRAKIEHRRELAERLDLTANALSIRACRIRAKLERCVRSRVAEA